MGACGMNTNEVKNMEPMTAEQLEKEQKRIDLAIQRLNVRRRWEKRLKEIKERNEKREKRREAKRKERRETRKKLRLLKKYHRMSKNLFIKCKPYLLQKNLIPDLYIKKAADIRRKSFKLYDMHEANENIDRITGLKDLEGAKIMYYNEIKNKYRVSIRNRGARMTWWMAEKEKINEGFKNEYYCFNNNIKNPHYY